MTIRKKGASQKKGRPINPIGPQGDCTNPIQAWASVLAKVAVSPSEASADVEVGVGRVFIRVVRAWLALKSDQRAEVGAKRRKKKQDQTSREVLADVVEKFVTAVNKLAETHTNSKGVLREVADLHNKIAGRSPSSYQDMFTVLAALVYDWTRSSDATDIQKLRDRLETPCSTLAYSAELLAILARREVNEYDCYKEEVQGRLFTALNNLARIPTLPLDADAYRELACWIDYARDYDTVAAASFLSASAREPGALITATNGSVFLGSPIGSASVAQIKDFSSLLDLFASDGEGLLIFVLDASTLYPGQDWTYEKLFDLNMLIFGLKCYAFLGGVNPHRNEFEAEVSVRQRNWQKLKQRCCVVVSRPPLLDSNGKPLIGQEIDNFVRGCGFEFEPLPPDDPGIGFHNGHIVSARLPEGIRGSFALRDGFHLNVRLKATDGEPKISYFVVPGQQIGTFRESDRGDKKRRHRHVTGDAAFLIKSREPTEQEYAHGMLEAYRNIYSATRGRLGLDKADKSEHQRNLTAVANLRKFRFEVFPVSIAASILLTPDMARSAEYALGSQEG